MERRKSVPNQFLKKSSLREINKAIILILSSLCGDTRYFAISPTYTPAIYLTHPCHLERLSRQSSSLYVYCVETPSRHFSISLFHLHILPPFTSHISAIYLGHVSTYLRDTQYILLYVATGFTWLPVYTPAIHLTYSRYSPHTFPPFS